LHKKELVESLRKYCATYDIEVSARRRVDCRGQKTLAAFLADYFEKLNIPSDEKYDFWSIDDYLPKLLVAAFETLRTSDEEWVVGYRQKFERESEHKVPNITDLKDGSTFDMFDRSSDVQTLGFMMRDLMGERGERIKSDIDKYCNAQHYVLKQTMDKFLRRVWWRGMYEMTNRCRVSGMSGKFSETELRTFVTGGRVMLTFARRKEGRTGVYLGGELVEELPYQEDDVSFVGDDSDPLGLGTGLQSLHADLRTAQDMIEDVINNWPENEEEREKVYKVDKKVSIV